MSHRAQYHAGPVLALAILGLLSIAALTLAPLGRGWGRDLPILGFGCGGWLLGPLAWAQSSRHLSAIREGRADSSAEGLIHATRIIAALSMSLTLMILALGFFFAVSGR